MTGFVKKRGFPEHPDADGGVPNTTPQAQQGDAPAAPRPAQQHQAGNNWQQVGMHPTARKTDPHAWDVV